MVLWLYLAVLEEILEDSTGTKLAPRTIRARLNEQGYKRCKACKKPFISAKNRATRVVCAKKHLSWTVEQWKTVLWADESPFVFRWHGDLRV